MNASITGMEQAAVTFYQEPLLEFDRKPSRFLRDGDVVVMEVSGIGALRNPVRRDAH